MTGIYGHESGAEKYLRESEEYYAQDTARYLSRKAQKEKLLHQAAQLEDQAKYQSGYKYKQTMREAADLRREDGRL